MMLRSFSRTIAFLGVTAAAGCYSAGGGDDDDSGPYGAGVCDALINQLENCGVATTSGEVGCGSSSLSLCEVQCMANADCQELSDLSCLGTTSSAILDCFDACGDATLMCGDGSGSYAPEQRCDGFDYCGDGSDERGCAMFDCDDGEQIPVLQRCDNLEQCFDGSDEDNCGSLSPICGGGGSGGTAGSGGTGGSTGGFAGSLGGSGGTAGSGGSLGGSGGTGGVTTEYVSTPTESCDRIMERVGECDTSGDYYLYCYDDTYTYDKCLADCVAGATCEDVLASACDMYAANDLYTCWNNCFETAYFACADGLGEVSETWLCDGYSDCADGSDEAGCPVTPQHECPNDSGYTYPSSYRCDGFSDCPTDGADELGCACLEEPAP